MTNGNPDPRLSRFYWNLRLFGLPEPIRDLWMVAVTVLLIFALTGQDSKIARQREGRKVAIEILCGAQQGTIDAARASLTQPVGPPAFRRALERLGYPPRRVTDAAAQKAVTGYSKLIAHAIEREAGVSGLLDVKTGQLQCDRLVQAGRAK